MDRRERMLSYLPEHYAESPEMRGVTKSSSGHLDELTETVEDVFNQFFVDTATWGLTMWEDELDIYPGTTDLYHRRQVVKSKLSESNPANYKEIEREVNRFLKEPTSKVRLINGRYAMKITFPLNDIIAGSFTELTDVVEEIKPAHLSTEIITQRSFDLGLNIGGATSNYLQTHISPPKFEMPDLQSNIFYGALVSKYDKTEISTPPFTMDDLTSNQSYGGAFSTWQQTTILMKGAV